MPNITQVSENPPGFFFGENKMDKAKIEQKLETHEKEISEIKESIQHLEIDFSSIKENLQKVNKIYDNQVHFRCEITRLQESFENMHKVIFQYNKTVDSLEYSIVKFNERLALVKYIPLMIFGCFILALMFDGSTLENIIHSIL